MTGCVMILEVYNLMKEKVGELELSDEVFGLPETAISIPLLHQVVVSQLNARRSGTACAKTRGEVNRSTKKLYRQKGTGRARAGSANSPTRVGGGVAFGPRPRSYDQKVPKKMRKLALKMALSDKVQGNELILVEDLNLESHKTKFFKEVLDRFSLNDKVLVVTSEMYENLDLSTRNLSNVKVLKKEGLNVYDILNHAYLFMDRPSILKIQEALLS